MSGCGSDQVLLSVDEALARVMAAATPLGTETLSLAAARNRVLAADTHTQHPLPLFTQSAVDGYAVRQADLAALPARLPLAAPIAARAQATQPVLRPGMAARILTGGLLPLGADTVVRQERTARNGEAVIVLEAVATGTDIREQGEEMPQGAPVAAAGTCITPGLVGALALAGVSEVRVFKLPRIVVLVSGDEVVRDGSALQLGQVPDANGPLLQAHLCGWGLPPLRIEAVADTREAVSAAMARAFADADLVLTTGGVSVGDHDYIPSVAESLGAERLFWKVAQKPGMPLYVARHRGALLFGLPGNPASVLVNLMVYVRAALDSLQGLEAARRWQRLRLPSGLKRDAQKTLWLRGVMTADDEGRVTIRTLGGQASHMLGNLAEADALLRVDPSGDLGCWASLR
ncbi:MAG: gephyrin-like molybdotransferase Glp [Pseudomonadota bacterium]